MKTLSRDSIQRMAGGVSSNTSISGGGGGGGSAGISTGWVEANFLSKEFFNLLFEVHISTRVLVKDGEEVISDTTTAGVLTPNDIIPETATETDPETGYVTTTTVTLTSIEAKSNFWSSLAISALGQGSGGGGGGNVLFEPLLSINASGLAAPGAAQNGMTVVWNNTTHKWEYGSAGGGGGTVTSITAGTGLSGGTITASGTIALSTETQTNIGKGVTAYGWGDHAQVGYATQTWVGQQGFLTSSALNGYATQSWVNQQGFLKSVSGTFWGNSWSNGGTLSGDIIIDNGYAIRFKNSSGDNKNVLTLNSLNQLAIGYNTRQMGYVTDIQGDPITFATNNGTTGGTDNRLEVGEFSSAGRFWIKQGTQGLRIGDGLITWDSTYNALKVQRISSGSVVDGGLYATSFISALGANTSGGGGTSADSGLATSYTLPYTTNETYRYWHKLGTYQMDTASMCLVIDLFSGNGYNGNPSQNSWARIMIKKGSSSSTLSTVGITCEQFGRQISDGKILVRVYATAYNTGEVWVKCPWGYPKGSYSVQGNFTAWTHNNTTSGDSTTEPTHNQNAVGYYDNTSTMSTSE